MRVVTLTRALRPAGVGAVHHRSILRPGKRLMTPQHKSSPTTADHVDPGHRQHRKHNLIEQHCVPHRGCRVSQRRRIDRADKCRDPSRARPSRGGAFVRAGPDGSGRVAAQELRSRTSSQRSQVRRWIRESFTRCRHGLDPELAGGARAVVLMLAARRSRSPDRRPERSDRPGQGVLRGRRPVSQARLSHCDGVVALEWSASACRPTRSWEYLEHAGGRSRDRPG